MAKITLTKKGIILLFFVLLIIGGIGTFVVVKLNQANENSNAALPTCTDDKIGEEGCKGTCWSSWNTHCVIGNDGVGHWGSKYGEECLSPNDDRCTQTNPAAHCSNGTQDDDETGVDCGGDECNACNHTCSPACPANQHCADGTCIDNTPGPTCTCTSCNGTCSEISGGGTKHCVCTPTGAKTCSRGTDCSGSIPNGYVWSCWGGKCVQEKLDGTPGGGCTYLAPDGTFKDCGCSMTACVNECKAANAGDPGHHDYGDYTCANCGQGMGCSCDIPTTGTNKCEFGHLDAPAAGTQYSAGQVVRIEGWAADPDDVTNFVLKVDGVVVPNANAAFVLTAACPSRRPDLCNGSTPKYPNAKAWQYDWTVPAGATGNHTFAVTWTDGLGNGGSSCKGNTNITITTVVQPICGDGILGNTDGEKCEVGNPSGVSCAWDDCNHTTCQCPPVVNPSWSITKNAVPVCINPNTENVSAQVTYDIVVTNTSTVVGILNRVVDTPASTKYAWLQQSSIDPSFGVATQTSNGGFTITWTLTGTSGEFAAGQSKHYRYVLIIPKASFGTYLNTATGYPTTTDTGKFEVNNTTYAMCDIPGTGLFDEVEGRIALGVMLLLVGVVYLYFEGTNGVLTKAYKFASGYVYQGPQLEKSRDKFEKKLVGKKKSSKK